MRSNSTQSFSSLTIVRAGLFIAMSLALKIIFEIYIPIAGIPALRINFASIPIMLSGIILGPFVGLITGALADIINFIIKPGGPFFPGFTLVSALSGFIPGVIYKYLKKDISFNLLNSIFIFLLSIAFLLVFVSKGVLKFENSIIYDNKPLSMIYVIGFIVLVMSYLLVPMLLTKKIRSSYKINKIVFTVSATQLITSIILNTWFLAILYGKGFMIFLPTRILSNFFIIPLYSIIIAAILNALKGRFIK